MMKTQDIQIGSVYDLKVGRNTTPVRIMKAAQEGGWEAVTLAGNKPVAIQSAERLVGLYNPKKASPSAQGGKASPKPRKPTTRTQKAAQSKRGPMSPKVQRLSALDAAVRVLAEANGPMTCRQLIETMAAKDYWKSASGKTPANTLCAAILKEITTKGDDSRFQKVGRGQFVWARK
ncbi:MAG TPA: winged helix-turn-helix domain-containing protein [Anaerohalosphaeraceae bacterium]|nr:winged helix-turn-helix domain-containing protein [Anaerohalosphaeraceae bacterium]